MLQLRETRIVTSKHMPVASGVQIPEEGIALAYVKEAGDTKVQPATGVAGEVFAGVSFARNSAPAMLPNVETGVVGAGKSITLARTPLAGQVMVKVGSSVLTLGGGAPADAAHGQIVGDHVTFHADHVGSAYTVQYIYAPTVIEARAVKGDVQIGGLASVALGVVGVVQNAEISTNFFDASQDWSGALYAKLAANGTFAPAADAASGIHGVIVKNTPSSANPFLSLSMNVA